MSLMMQFRDYATSKPFVSQVLDPDTLSQRLKRSDISLCSMPLATFLWLSCFFRDKNYAFRSSRSGDHLA